MAGQRISTHPSYTEYSWDALARPTYPQRPMPPQNPQTNRRPQTQRSTGAARGAAAPRGRMQQSTAAQMRGRMYGQPQMGAHAARPRGGQAHSRQAANARADAARKAAQSRAKASAAIKAQAQKAEKLRRKSIVTLHTIVVEKKYSFPLAIVLIALCFTILIMAIVTTSVQISEITTENSMLERQYNALVSEENELRLRLETRDDLRVVETMAKTELGMVKKDQVERYYLTVRKEDKIEIVEEVVEKEASILDGILSFGGSIVERVRAFFGM